jgi:hypothetical protein
VFLPRAVAQEVASELERLGTEVLSDRIFGWVTDAERNKPYVRGGGRDTFGRWTGELVVGEGWRELQAFGIQKGFAIPQCPLHDTVQATKSPD